LGVGAGPGSLLQSLETLMGYDGRLPNPAKDLHVVTLHFRGLRLINVSPYRLGDPEVRLVHVK
jgi:hypothetical protein